MADNSTRIVITAEDKTRAAIDSVTGNFKQLQGALGGIDSVAGRLPGIGAAVAAAFGAVSFTGVIKGAVDYAGRLNDLSLATGTTVETLASLRNAGELSEKSIEDIAGALETLTKEMRKAAEGSEEQVKNFAALGISVVDAKGALRDSGETMLDLAKAVAAIESPTERAAAAQLALKNAGAGMVPLLLDLAERGLEVANVTTEQAKQADALGDSLTIMRQRVRDAGESFGLSLLPALAATAEVAQGAMFGIQQVGASMAVVAKDIETAVKVIGAALGGGFTEEGQDYIKRTLEERSRFVEAANQDMQDKALRYKSILDQVLNAGKDTPTGTGASDALAARLKKLREEAEAKAKKGKKRDSEPEDYAARTNQAVANAINGSAVVRARELADQIETLDKLFFEAGLDAEIYASAMDKLTGHTDKAASETERLNKLLAATPTAELEKTRDDMQLLAKALEEGRISEEQFVEATQSRLGTLAEKVKEVDDFARDMGLTFSSAFEDAIVGGKDLSEVLKGLSQDVARIVTRKTVTEPLGNAASDALKNIDFGSLFSFDGGGYTGSGARAGGIDGKGGFLAVMHPQETVVDHVKGGAVAGGGTTNHFTVDMRGASIEAVARLEQLVMSVNGSIERRAVNAMRQAGVRG